MRRTNKQTKFGDRIEGRNGNDSLLGNSDKITESLNQGIDKVNSSVNHTLRDHVENLTLIGTAAINVQEIV